MQGTTRPAPGTGSAGARTVVGTPTFGYIVDATGSYAIAWQALADVLALGTLNIAVFVSEGRRGEASPAGL